MRLFGPEVVGLPPHGLLSSPLVSVFSLQLGVNLSVRRWQKGKPHESHQTLGLCRTEAVNICEIVEYFLNFPRLFTYGREISLFFGKKKN